MTRAGFLALTAAGLAAAAGGALWWRRAPAGPDDAAMAARYATPLPPPDRELAVYHLGHSLVNFDIPEMLAQLAGEGHRYESQLGWGATLKSHWGDDPVNGFEEVNIHPRFRPSREALASGDYDVLVVTEMVEIRDALRYHDSPRYLALLTEEMRRARPDARVYLYETWHLLNDPEGWLERLDVDLDRYWDREFLRPALGRLPEGAQIHLIPGGQTLAAFVRAVEARGGVGNVRDRTDIFDRTNTGEVDQIHLNDLGNYLMALIHYSVIYQQSPVGLPYELRLWDGAQAVAPSPEVARLMQEVAWEVARSTPLTGVAL